MAVSDIDFEDAGVQGSSSTPDDKSSPNPSDVLKQHDTTHLNGGGNDDITGKDGNSDKDSTNDDKANDDDNTSTGELNAGDTIDVDGTIYTVDKDGNLVDDKGTIFKEAKDVVDWLKSVNVEDGSDNEPLSLASIQDALGVTITDEHGKNVEFTNDANGVKSYVDSVLAVRSQELQEAAINRLYQDNPLLKQFQDYVQINGTHRGFGDLPDRSGIQLDKDNEAQLVAVIKMAASEFGNKSLNDNYIKYLHDSGSLYDEAKAQLAALVEKDNNYRKEIEAKAEEQRKADAEATANYWASVDKIISNRVINGYRIPETFTKEVDGRKITITPKDFFDYISVPKETADGRRSTAYQQDLAKLTDEEYMNREMLDAWLMFAGGTYKDLIDMAVKEDKVRQLRVKSKEQRSTKTVKIIKNPNKKSSIDDIALV